jgi:cell division septation protein DedD
MFRWAYFSGALISCAATVAVAQTTTRPTDPVFVRAQALVSDGNGAAGRALVDSVLAATPPGAPLYPQALFWRATLASNAADAESDYKHIVVDYPLAPQAEDALLRLAQLELARGDRDGALAHLQRIPRDYPRSKSLARANYWTARVLFEKNDVLNACAANASALAQADTNEIELRNQIEYQGQRCRSIVTNAAPPVPSSAVSASSTPTSQGTPLAKEKVETVDTLRPKPPSATAKETASSSSGYSVQVAAYNHRADADKLSSSLSKRGYQARVDGEIAPFRVRIGRYATAKEAEEALRRIKAKHMDGFVVRVPQR